MNKIDILNTLKKTISNNKYIKVNVEGLDKLAASLSKESLTMPYFECSSELSSIEDIVQYFFVANTINFKFWYDNNKSSIYTFDGKVDSMAMFHALNKNLWLLDAEEMMNLHCDQVSEVFGNNPMVKERTELLIFDGCELLRFYKGKAINLLEEGNFEMPKILDLMFNMYAWDDFYNNHLFMKRAQLFLAMVHGNLQDNSPLKGIEELTLYADYQVPRALEYLGVLDYSEELNNRILNSEVIEHSSEEELAIRSYTIYAGELLSDKLKCPTPYIDYLLWLKGKDVEKPHHYTKTIWY